WGYWFYSPPRGGSQAIATGSARVEKDGTFKMSFTPEADEREAQGTSPGVTYRYQVSADLTDEGGETRSASRSFRLGFVAVEAQVDFPAAFFRDVAPARATVTRTDLDGAPRAGEGTFRLLRLVPPGKTLLPAEMPREN